MEGIKYTRFDSSAHVDMKTCRNNLHSSKTHFHEELSIGFIEKGSTSLEIKRNIYKAEKGDAVIIYPYVSHMCRPSDLSDWAFTMFFIGTGLYRDIPVEGDPGNLIKIIRKDHPVYEKIIMLKNTFNSFPSSSCLKKDLHEVFELIPHELHDNTGEKALYKIGRVKKYIEEHYRTNFSLDDVSAEFSLNKFTMIREFKKIYNTTPSAYHLQLKINTAKKMLEERNDIVNIALDAGFYDQSHFSREFKNAYGITPLQYHNSVNKKQVNFIQ